MTAAPRLETVAVPPDRARTRAPAGLVRSLPVVALGLVWFAVHAVALQAMSRSIPALAVVVVVADVAVVRWFLARAEVAVAIPLAMMSVVALDWHALPPTHSHVIPDVANGAALAAYLVTATLLGHLAESVIDRARESERVRGELADEHAALRRVATLVAEQDSADRLFATVVREAQQVLGVDVVTLMRYEPHERVTVLADARHSAAPLAVGETLSTQGDSVASMVRRTGAPAGIDDYSAAQGPLAERMRALGVRASIACPITVDGAPWGVMVAATTRADQALAPELRQRIAEFTDLVGTAIANAASQTELRRSRARVVARGDEIRRQLERDLHDGVQQRLVSLALFLRMGRDRLDTDPVGAAESLGWVQDELSGVVDDLRELSHGIHPAIVAAGGLGPAVATLARRTPLLVDSSVADEADGSVLTESLQVGAYYTVAEALTNAVKHAAATRVVVRIEVDRPDGGAGDLVISVADDGIGGADVDAGTGLLGLRDRVEALGGRLVMTSPAGEGTTLVARIPLAQVEP